MKKLLVCLFAFLFCVSVAFAETINLDLSAATDEELADALQKIVAEQKARIKTTLTLDQTELTLGKGKQATLKATIDGLPEGAKTPKIVWTTSDKKIATVANGKVKAVDAGIATITATITLDDGFEVTADCKVTGIVSVSGVKADQKSFALQMNGTAKMTTTVTPENASNKKVFYSSSDKYVATVDQNGNIKAVGGGKCTITATAMDGSAKSTSCTVTVSSFGAVPATATVTSKKGNSFKWKYYGSRWDLDYSLSSYAYADVSYSSDSDNTVTFMITPIKAGTFTLTLKNGSNPSDKVQCKITVDPMATYSKQSYPSIDYDSAARYPAAYKGDQTSFSGKVLQVIDGFGYTSYRISSRGNYKDVVYVVLNDEDVTVPLIEDDKVTVYGKYDGNYSYTTVLGSQMTIPKVQAEKIVVK